MIRIAAMLLALGLLSACLGGGTNPFDDETETEEEQSEEEENVGIFGDDLPPGTTSPSPETGITRYEENDGDGSGMVETVTYNNENGEDTFTVDNLAFDGDDAYSRDDQVGTLNSFAVYENAGTVTDPVSGKPINQLSHKALYRVGPSGETKVAIVRTGAYADYGFGGFIYQRSGDVTLPTSGQATYSGDYAALRDFEGVGGMEYAEGDMTVSIDFDDFNNGAGVVGQVANRTIYDTAGNDITADVLTALSSETGTTYTALPSLNFVVSGSGNVDANGEMMGELNSRVINASSGSEIWESGNYYAILSGENAGEIAGVLVITSDDPRFENVTTRETGGFILAR
ncbi:hypothetical protein SAMN04490248_10277 [Salinihabitans flavidus]|uniref:Transferrin-binding protein B C-lobe/N-lobe beta barrel domain-containing protein n=1 Tax=Salinihabitans flavidus TaxID=569882 RepID=A0A1H8MGY6_9RHOB|nr:hypothetical protein [Salinihabitans flavidus]SEO16550.1 hypothetical protein SAMN04490248_10277 [Salinihabitans flavidus]